MDLLIRKVFGSSSEQLDLDQLLLFDPPEEKKPGGDGPATELESSPFKKRAKRTSREATLPADLPVEETILIPDEVREYPENYRQVSEETTTKLDYRPARFLKLITRRPKFVKRLVDMNDPDADRFYVASLPPSLKERSLLTPGLAAEIATSRFCDHQPYYRQEQHFLMRHGVHLPRNIMSQWMADLSNDYLSGIYQAMHRKMLGEIYLQVDETPIAYLAPALDESHGPGQGGVGLQDLGQPRPENDYVAIVPDTLREGGFVHEPGGQDVGELQGVGGICDGNPVRKGWFEVTHESTRSPGSGPSQSQRICGS